MSLNRIFSIMFLLLVVCAGNAFAACPNDIYFKTTRTQYMSVSQNDFFYRDIDLDGRKGPGQFS